MSFSNSEDFQVNRADNVDLLQVIPLVLATALLTIGLAMFLSGTTDGMELIQPVIVVFGGTLVALLATFSLSHLGVAMQMAINRGIRGGSSSDEMIRALMKICDISRRDGLLGVAEVRTNSESLGSVCQLIADAADEQTIQFGLDKHRGVEKAYHGMYADVFLFTAVYAVLIGGLGSVIRAVSASMASVAPAAAMPNVVLHTLGSTMLPAVCGVCLALLMAILVGRLRAAHQRELIIVDVAYQGAAIILEDNNVQRLRARLFMALPKGIR